MAGGSAIYQGTVIHRRLRPRQHALRYAAFWLLLDLDGIPAIADGLTLFSHNRFNLFSFHDRDHGNGSDTPLRPQIEAYLRQAGLDPAGLTIRLLCMPRVLGYTFNPLSVFFCERRDGSLAALVYEVHNTFGERHTYFIPVDNRTDAAGADGSVEQSCAKTFHVSPFMDMAMKYAFRVTAPGDRLSVVIRTGDTEGPMLLASLAANRRPLSDAELLRVFARIPLAPMKVIAAIHYEALRLWLKGIAVRRKPPAPAQALDIVRPSPERSAAHALQTR